ncbi:hypothetical protein [Paenibacillus sp. SI8]|uniref:hypothetical protein n=1 Tax=unclassified Paenibacillus TaxID=185978 RepID=UPI0034652881
MVQIIDFGRSVPAAFSSSVTLPILGAPSNLTIAQFGVQVSPAGQVLLNATVGTQTTLGAPDVLYSIFRGITVVFTVKSSSLQPNQFNLASFNYVDLNPPSGYTAYSLTAEITNNLLSNRANVIGPIVFSGLSLL